MKLCIFGFGKPCDKTHIFNLLSKENDLRVIAEPKGAEHLAAMLRDDGGIDIAVVNTDRGLDTVRRISHMSDCKVIGVGDPENAKTVIEAMRAGCCQFVSRPATLKDIRLAIDSIRVTEGMRTSKRLCVVGSSGAAGATMVACHMAIELSTLAGSAAIVDLDLELGVVDTFFDISPGHCLTDACRTKVDSAALRRTVVDVDRVSVLARPSNIRDIGDITPEAIDQVFLYLAELFPYVVVDMSRPNGELGASAMCGADCVIIVAQANVMSMRNAVRVCEAASEAGVSADCIKLILNRCGSACHKLGDAEIAKVFGGEVLANIPNDWATVRECMDLGQALPDESPARMEIKRMVRRLIGAKPETPKPRRRLQRLFGIGI